MMRNTVRAALLLFAIASAASAQELAIRNVTIIAPGSPSIPGQTVVIRGDRIAAVGPASEVVVAKDARTIDGAGKYLMPGLVEMHAHTSKTRASSLALFVINGVTTLRDMGGDHEELLKWRREIRAGTRVGPRMLIAGPYLESTANIERMRKDPIAERVEPFDRIRIGVGSAEDARRVVASLAAKEIDFIKIRTVANRETYIALNEAANAHGIPLVGHVTGMTPDVVLAAGQDSVEHFFWPTLQQPSREERVAFWRRFAASGAVMVPTMVTLFHSIYPATDEMRAITEDREGKVDPRSRYLARFTVLDWREQVSEATDQRRSSLRKLYEDFIRRDLREMHEAGVDVLAGSDVAVLNIFPGSTLHDELALFVTELGMTPAEAIDRATRRSACFLRLGDSIGTIERGKIADLVLLEADPLQDITNTKRITAVVAGGKLYDHAAMEKLRAAILTAPDLKSDDWGRH
jgi:imidazolonepropionase-like amidohydrolase